MKLSEMTQSTMRVCDLIDFANAQFTKAQSVLELVQWISPIGDLYIEPKAIIEEMITTGSWR